jgi:hypothetical protein
MDRRRSVVLLAVLVAATPGCRKRAPADAKDAASNADASSSGDAGAMVDDASTPALPVATTAPTPTPTSTELAAQQPPQMPFAGTYRCFGGMKLEQAGRIVTATIRKGTTDTILACTASSETCTGTVREIQMVHGKPPKVNHVKPVTLTLTRNSDVVYVVGSAEKKAGQGDQTFCPRR